jgi:hypothetical protein
LQKGFGALRWTRTEHSHISDVSHKYVRGRGNTFDEAKADAESKYASSVWSDGTWSSGNPRVTSQKHTPGGWSADIIFHRCKISTSLRTGFTGCPRDIELWTKSSYPNFNSQGDLISKSFTKRDSILNTSESSWESSIYYTDGPPPNWSLEESVFYGWDFDYFDTQGLAKWYFTNI